MDAPWFYAHGGAPRGPVSRDDLRLAVLGGEVGSKSLVWREGMPQWQPLEDVEELLPLLAHLPPPLPPQTAVTPPEPPPLPAETTSSPRGAERPGEAPDERTDGGSSAERTDQENDGTRSSRKRRQRGRLASWLLSKTMVAILTTVVIVGATVVFVIQVVNRQSPVPQAATGQVRIDANPWGRIESIEGPSGLRIDLPEGRTTPFSMTLPVGTYQARVVYPHSNASQQCELQVRSDQVATCWLDLAPVDAQAYFRTIGW